MPFGGWGGLEEITLSGVTNVQRYALYNCTNLTHFGITKDITAVGDFAFANCRRLLWNTGKLSLPGIASVGNSAFSGCVRIEDARLGERLSSLGGLAFENCSLLTNVWFQGAPPSVGNSPFRGVADGAWGHYTAKHSSEWLPQIGSDGKWQGLIMSEERKCTVSFDANGGTGSMAAWTVSVGETLVLPANTFKRENHVFSGWAKTAGGKVAYRDGAKVTVAGDMTLYAVWTNPTLALEAESADWAHGSVTLRCSDADTGGEEHSYSLFYRDHDTWNMIPVEGEGAVNVSVGEDGFAHLTDPLFAGRHGGLGEVHYCVADETGRVSDVCTMRKRHGLYVGVGEFEEEYAKEHRLEALPGAAPWAREFARVARARGGFDNLPPLVGRAATRSALDDALDSMAAMANPGDICLFYLHTHGAMDGTEGVFCMYDGDYIEPRLVGKIEEFYNKGVAFIAVLGTCQAEALVQRSFPNVGIIAAAGAESESTDFFEKFLVDYGWERGWAGSGDAVSFGELAEYAKSRYETLYNGIVFGEEGGENMTVQTQIDNEGLLGRITAGTRGTHANTAGPDAITGIKASQGTSGNQIEVNWDADDRADGFVVFAGSGESSIYLDSRGASKNETGVVFRVLKHPWLAETSASRPAVFEVRAYNGAGVGVSDIADGWIDADATTGVPLDWLQCHPRIMEAAGGDAEVAATMTAANGKMTVAECYALGIDPEDEDDDLLITHFEMVDGKPVIDLNHTEDGSGNSFLSDVRTFGATSLGETDEWDDVTDIGKPGVAGYRFFKVVVDTP